MKDGKKKQSPIYDDKVKQILQGLQEGKNRKEVAGEMGYKNYKGMDMYMRRRNFRWEKANNTYVAKHSKDKNQKIDRPANSSRITQAILLFQKHIDPKEVAIKVGFTDHNELAAFMKEHGYIWSGEEENYVLETEEATVEEKEEQERLKNSSEENEKKRAALQKNALMKKKIDKMDKYIPVIDLLYKNQENITALLEKEMGEEQLPRYVLKGDDKNKNIYMNRLLANLLEEFSSEKKISQRDVVEGALIEYFRRYAYEQVNELLNTE